jgi:hypothetical protein
VAFSWLFKLIVVSWFGCFSSPLSATAIRIRFGRGTGVVKEPGNRFGLLAFLMTCAGGGYFGVCTPASAHQAANHKNRDDPDGGQHEAHEYPDP